MSSKTYWLTAVEVAHIQDFIFNSNRLRENVGASELVARATEIWALQAVRQAAGDNSNVSRTNKLITKEDNPAYDAQYAIELNTRIKAEVIYSGGGNFVALFDSEATAQAFARHLSRKVITDAPNLRLNLHSIPYEWEEGTLHQRVSEVKRDLKEQRSHNSVDAPLAGQSISVMCASTSMPAVWIATKPDYGLYAAETMAKRVAANNANKRLLEEDRLLGDDPTIAATYQFPMDFDELGRSEGDKSFIAVVHADGNRMGVIFQGLGDGKTNRDYIHAIRDFSERVKKVARDALRDTVVYLMRCIDEDMEIKGRNNQAALRLKLDEEANLFNLPFRPLVSGGDDVTFVADGRIGIALAAYFVRCFEARSEKWLGKQLQKMGQGEKLTAGVGVAIVKTHYPFARSYALAEDLLGEAKKLLHHHGIVKDFSSIDWHISNTGIFGDIDEIRRRDFHVAEGNLTLRPQLLSFLANKPEQSWETTEELIAIFQQGKDKGGWGDSRNKAKQLIDVLRLGRMQTRRFKERYLSTHSDPQLPAIHDFDRKFGWIDAEENQRQCVYFDALELLDLYVPLIPIDEREELSHV